MSVTAASILQKFQENPVISTDSRKISPGCLFFALKGDTFNGNQFASKALEQGAAYAIIDEPVLPDNPRLLRVDDVLKTLQQVALLHRRSFNIPIIAITGTNGKTTTKELINAVLSRKFQTTATQGNLNNHIGVPLTLLTLTPQTEIAIIEMGANHPGEIDQLCRIAEPNHGIITNIGKAHLEGFGNLEGVIQTKTELYRYLIGNRGTLVVNKDNPLLLQHTSNARVVTYGTSPAQVMLNSFTASPFVVMEVQPEDQPAYTIPSNLYGGYNVPNILAAATFGHLFEVDPGEIADAVANYAPTNNRSQILKTPSNLLILDAYNANPSSMQAALEAFATTNYENKMIILGDMLELGADSDEEHLKILETLTEKGFTNIYLIGPTFTRLNNRRETFCFDNTELATMWFNHHPPKNNTILIKGSRGNKLETLTPTM